MTKVKISKKRWSRGKQRSNALLINRKLALDEQPVERAEGPRPRHNTMCCLGFVCLTLGFTPGDIRGRPMPEDVSVLTGKEIPGLTTENVDDGFQQTDFAEKAAEINDNGNIDDEERMRRLQDLCVTEQTHFEFVFVD